MAGDRLADDAQLVRALVEWSSMAPSAVAKRAGLAATTLTRPFNGSASTNISRDTLAKLRQAFPDFPGWHGARPDLPPVSRQQDYLPVGVLPAFAGMGGGGVGDFRAEDLETALIPRHLIEDEFRGRAGDFKLIDVRGDSMEPIFLHGDQLLIDTRDRNPAQPGPFALFDGDAYVVKLVERVSGRRGWYRVFSANDRYSENEVEETETTIMGRPVWFARQL